jgi:two-component system nitrogen regulation response regulator NtrX
MALDILIVDDERDIRELVAGCSATKAMAASGRRQHFGAGRGRRAAAPLVLLDVWLHGSPMDGLEVLDAIKAREPELPVIIFSGHGNIDTAVSAIRRGRWISSKSRSRPSACCCWSNGRPRPSACAAKMPCGI